MAEAVIEAPSAVLVPAGRALPAPLASAMGWARPWLARPAVLAVAGLLMVALLGLALRAPDWRPLYGELSDGDKSAVLAALEGGNYRARVNPTTGAVEVAADEVAAARILLAGQGLPKAAAPMGTMDDMPMGMSRAVEAARLKAALAGDLAASVEAIDGVKRARVHVALAEPSVFVRDRAPASASVFVTLAPGRVLGEAQVRAIVWLVSSSVAGLAPERVSVVDQSGALLSAGVAAGDAAQLGYQARLEAMLRARLQAMLTPMLGERRFSAEVVADVDFSQSEAARERFADDGRALRAEQTSRTREGTAPPARGIPGALSNTVPAAAQVAATPPADTAAEAEGASALSETASRSWEIGKDVTVTRGGAPKLVRLSVAVVVDAAALPAGAAREAELAQLRRLVEGAVGADAGRGDRVELVAGRFVGEPVADAAGWLPEPVATAWPWVAGGLALLLLGGGVWIWRARQKRAVRAALERAMAEPAPAAAQAGPGAPVEAGLLPMPDHAGKLDETRLLVAGDADRAMAVARLMLRDDRPADAAVADQGGEQAA